MELCPKCGCLSYFDSYFRKMMCNTCQHTWKEEGKVENFQIEVKVTDLETFKRIVAENEILKLQLEKLKAASKEAAEILRDMVDVANATGSAYLYRRDTENVLRVIKALAVGDNEPHPDGPPSSPDGSGISQGIKNILHDMRNMPDGSTYSIALVREMLHSLLDEEGSEDDAP